MKPATEKASTWLPHDVIFAQQIEPDPFLLPQSSLSLILVHADLQLVPENRCLDAGKNLPDEMDSHVIENKGT